MSMVFRQISVKTKWGPFFCKVTRSVRSLVSPLQVILTRQSFGKIPNVLRCREKRMFVIVENQRLFCWTWGASVHMSKACPGKKVAAAQPQPTTTTATTTTVAAVAATEAEKAPNGVWTDGKREKKATNPLSPQQQKVPPPKQQHPPQERCEEVVQQQQQT